MIGLNTAILVSPRPITNNRISKPTWFALRPTPPNCFILSNKTLATPGALSPSVSKSYGAGTLIIAGSVGSTRFSLSLLNIIILVY